MSIQAIMKLVSDPFTEAYVKVHDCAYGSITVGDLAMLVYRLRHREARINELEGFLEEVISRDPEVHRTWVRDPQDEVPDLIEHDELLVLQDDARELLKGGK